MNRVPAPPPSQAAQNAQGGTTRRQTQGASVAEAAGGLQCGLCVALFAGKRIRAEEEVVLAPYTYDYSF